MFTTEDQEAIVRFVFSKEENVELALGVMAAGDAIREKIIKEFLTRLEDELRRKVAELGESWKVVNDLIKDPFKRWEEVYITKQQWGGLYAVFLEPEKPGPSDFVLGVWGDRKKPPKGLDEGPVREALQQRFGRGMTNEGAPFYMRANERYRDWADGATLCGLHGDRAKQAIEYFANTMVAMAGATQTLIDSLVDKWGERQQSK